MIDGELKRIYRWILGPGVFKRIVIVHSNAFSSIAACVKLSDKLHVEFDFDRGDNGDWLQKIEAK